MARHILILANEAVRERALHWVRKAPLGYRIWFAEPKRTTEQNDKMWAMLSEISAQAKLHGAKQSPENWKAVFMKSLGHQVEFLPTLEGDVFFPVGMKSSKLSVREMADLISLIQAWGDQNGVRFNDEFARAA